MNHVLLIPFCATKTSPPMPNFVPAAFLSNTNLQDLKDCLLINANCGHSVWTTHIDTSSYRNTQCRTQAWQPLSTTFIIRASASFPEHPGQWQPPVSASPKQRAAKQTQFQCFKNILGFGKSVNSTH